MTRFDLAIRRLATPFVGAITALTLMASATAHAEIDIASLGGQSTMAEQGAICASFAALMENQYLINQDLGDLWSERRKFSGAVIRRAVELSGQLAPDSEQIDTLINDYREWLILNLSAQEPTMSRNDYQSDVQNMIKTNCKSLYAQADKAILKRFPALGYLINGTAAQSATDKKQLDAMMAKNNELNIQIIALRAEIGALKVQKQARKTATPDTATPPTSAPLTSAPAPTPAPATAPTPPTPRPAIAKKQEAQAPQKVAQVPNTANKSATQRFFAQLGSFSSADIAQQAIDDFSQNYPDLFATIALEIEPHLFASGKTFYRVKTSRAERPMITGICDKLWDARLGCLIKTNVD